MHVYLTHVWQYTIATIAAIALTIGSRRMQEHPAHSSSHRRRHPQRSPPKPHRSRQRPQHRSHPVFRTERHRHPRRQCQQRSGPLSRRSRRRPDRRHQNRSQQSLRSAANSVRCSRHAAPGRGRSCSPKATREGQGSPNPNQHQSSGPNRAPAPAIAQQEPTPPPAPAPPPPPPPPAFRDVTIPSGTTIPVRITQTLDSATTQQGQSFSGTLATDVMVDGLVAIRQGTAVNRPSLRRTGGRPLQRQLPAHR